MKALVVSIWVFINLVFFGMCGYMYLLWSQYWMFMERQTATTTSTYDQQIYYYNRGYLPPDLNKTHNYTEIKLRSKHSLKDNITFVRNSKPRFPNLQGNEFELDTKKFVCLKNDSAESCAAKTEQFKEKILKEMRRVLEEEGNVLRNNENFYNVHYSGNKKSFEDKSIKEVMCELQSRRVQTLKREDVRSNIYNLREFLPKRNFYENKKFNTCAIISSAGALRGSNLGNFIDSHELVLRFNDAPTKNFETDVGQKTTIRLLNSQVVSKRRFNFLGSQLFKNVTIVAWDPSNYSASVEEWLEKPEFNLFPNYVEYKIRNDKGKFFLVNPKSLWELWEFLQNNTPVRLKRNPPSSGFLGVGILLPVCRIIDIFEYVPSARASKRCHYYDPEDNPACTFGVWHPLAAEKLLTYYINTMDDETVFQKGYVRVAGLKNFKC